MNIQVEDEKNSWALLTINNSFNKFKDAFQEDGVYLISDGIVTEKKLKREAQWMKYQIELTNFTAVEYLGNK